jgi:hypothetical protein
MAVANSTSSSSLELWKIITVATITVAMKNSIQYCYEKLPDTNIYSSNLEHELKQLSLEQQLQ